jgi:L-fuculose-phosphate aldolase
MNYRYMHPRDELVVTMERIYRYKMTTTSGGNLSILDEDGDIWITPARVDKGALNPADIVCVRSDGGVIGRHPPSSEFPFHRAIYQARPGIRAVVHAHPMALVAFSIAHKVPETRVIPQAWQIEGNVGFAPYGVPGSEDLGLKIAAKFSEGYDSVILENHGVCCGGADLQTAFQKFETLEFTAKSIIKARQLGEIRSLTDVQLQLQTKSAGGLRTFERDEIPTREKELRRELCDFIERGYRQRLLTSTAGTFSARVDKDSFLITPYPFDRYDVDPGDLVLVRGQKAESGRAPSRAALSHRALYQAHPQIAAVVNAHPINATAFSICGMTVNTHTIPESYVFIRDVSLLPFETTYNNLKLLADTVTPRSPAAVLANNGVIVAGKSILAAFDQLEVLEYTAEALLDSRPIGGTQPMSPAVIAELRNAFQLE